MENSGIDDSAAPTASGSGGWWVLLLLSLVGAGAALVPCAGLLAQGAPGWLALAAGAATFPVLPLLWHFLAEAKRADHRDVNSSSRTRFGLRGLAVALLVLGVAFSDVGPRGVGTNLGQLFRLLQSKPAATPVPTPTFDASIPPPVKPSQPVARHGLEPFIPADATLVVGLAGSAAMQQLLSAYGVDTREKVAALSTCKIGFDGARVLIAARGDGAQMFVVRAAGITEERNLYCLVGVMGSDRLRIHFEGAEGAKAFRVTGFVSRPLTFKILDPMTIAATDDAWAATEGTKLFDPGTDAIRGRLAAPMDRIDRSTPLWSATIAETAQGIWDLAVDTRFDDKLFKLHGTSIPPAGATARAEIDLHVPLAFVSALPEGALSKGMQGVVSAVISMGAKLPLPAPLLAPSTADSAPAARAAPAHAPAATHTPPPSASPKTARVHSSSTAARGTPAVGSSTHPKPDAAPTASPDVANPPSVPAPRPVLKRREIPDSGATRAEP